MVSQLTNSLDSESSCIIVLKLETTSSKTYVEVYNEIKIILDYNKMLYHSIIITSYTDAIYSSSNITFKKIDASDVSPPKQNLN